MTLSTTTSRVVYDGDASTTAFSFPYKYISSSDLKAYLYDEDDDTWAVQTLNVNFTVAGSGLSNGVYGSAILTFSSAPGTDKKVVIFRDPALTQPTDFQSESNVLNALNRKVDLVEMKLQRASDRISRAIVLGDGDYPTTMGALPAKAELASTFLAFDVNGDPIASSGGSGDVPISAAMAPVVQVITLSAGARTLLTGHGYERMSWYGTNDAALTAAKAAAGVGGTIIFDNALVLASTATLAGYVSRFETGTITPPASSATLTLGKIEAPVARQIFVGSNLNRVRVNSECEFVRPEWWGAAADGATDDYSALAAALLATQLSSGIALRSAAYAFGTKLVIGDGTTTTRSTIHNGLFIRGDSPAGVGAGEFGTPNILTSLKWIGSSGANVAMTQIAGGIHSVEIRNVIFDCNAKAGIAGDWIHLYRCYVENVYAENWYAVGTVWTFSVRDNAAYVSPYSAGVTQGFMENVFSRFGARTPPAATAHCLSCTGGKTNHVGFSRNTFEHCQFVRGNDASSISITINYCDNNDFDRLLAVGTNATPYTGIALRRLTQSGSATFPTENVFSSCALVGTVVTQDDVAFTDSTDGGTDISLGYAGLNDGSDVTPPHGFRIITTDGRLLGRFTGSQYTIGGHINSGVGITTGDEYFLPHSYQEARRTGSGGGFQFLAPCDLYIERLQTFLATVPGAGVTRDIYVYVAGSNTALTVQYTAAQNGAKSAEGSIFVAQGSEINLHAIDSGGTAATSQFSWQLVLRNNALVGS